MSKLKDPITGKFLSGAACPGSCVAIPAVQIRLLGDFRLLKAGQAVPVNSGGKTALLLFHLALRHAERVPRDTLLDLLWPHADLALANQSLNSIVYSLRKLLADAIAGEAPVLCEDGYYRLNTEAGVRVDMACFERMADTGDEQARAGDLASATASYTRAIRHYYGDLSVAADVPSLIERERLRSRYLTLLARLADYYLREGEHDTCLDYAGQLLAGDPCREDAQRLVMHCYMRRGERAQALRQYRLCQAILRTEFDAVPEPATTALYDQIRVDPGSI